MKIILSIVSKFFTTIYSAVYFSFALAVIFIVSYIIGHNILDGALIGNDSSFALSLVNWFEGFYPKTPYWYPLQGMGVSMFHSYPMSTTFLVIMLKNAFGISSVESFRILSFLTFPLTALGIYLLAWTRLKNQTIALIASVFFLLSQASWLFQTLHGLFAQSFSLIFVAPSFLFFDLFLENKLKNQKQKFISRVYFVITIIFVGLAFLTHVVTGTMIAVAIVLWSVLCLLLSSEESFLPRVFISRVFKGTVSAILVVVFAQALIAFWLLPFSSYTALANKEGLNTFSLSMLREVSLRIPSLLGIGYLGVEPFRYDYFFFATPVLIFFAVGAVLSFFRKNKKIQVLSIISCVFMFLTTVPIYFPPLASMFKFFFTGVYFRGLIPVFILLPIVAAWGVFAIPETIILIPFRYISKKLMGETPKTLLAIFKRSTGAVLMIIVIIFSLGIFLWGIKNLGHKPLRNPDPEAVRQYDFGPYGPSLSKDFDLFLMDPLSYLSQKQEIKVNKKGLEGVTTLIDFLNENLDLKREIIVDVSPFAAGGAIMQGVGLRGVSAHFVNLYHFFASLTHGMWGYQQGVFYGGEKLYKSSSLLGDLTDWYGIKYAILTPGFDPFYKYEQTGWKTLDSLNKKTKDWGFEIWENPSANGLYTASSRPVVLVIGDSKKGMYDQVFRTANLGALPYKSAWLVEGKKDINSYSLEELKQFSGVILHGYSYSSIGNAWGMIKKYLEEGGNVFVDTGWQYVAKDWGDKNLPSVFPVLRTSWTNIGKDWKGVEINQDVAFGIDISKFEPPVWDSDPWGMSIAKRQDLKEKAVPILYKDDLILMASQNIGKGKIVWSGVNIFSHLTGKMNEEEGRFMGEIMKPLFATHKPLEFNVVFQRKSPDKVEFSFEDNINSPFWLLFRESYSPNWRVELSGKDGKKNIPIFRGGPGFILLRVPKVDAKDKIEISYGLGFKDGILAKVLSISTLVFLVLFIPLGGRINIKFFIPTRIKKIFQRHTQNFKKSAVEDEEDY